MPRAKISDAHGITIELEATEASYTDLGDKALELLAAATAIVDKRPTGPAGGGQYERRGAPTIGYGARYVQSAGRPIGYWNENDPPREPT